MVSKFLNKLDKLLKPNYFNKFSLLFFKFSFSINLSFISFSSS